MTVYQNMNQFAMGSVKGQCAAVPAANVISAQLTTASVGTPKAGAAVKLIAGQANTILVEVAAATDDIFGFIVWNPKKNTYAAGDSFEVALPGTVMTMESSSAFNRGQSLEIVASGEKVKAYAGTNTPCGVALDTASGAGQLVRVLIRVESEYSSSSSSSSCRSSSSSSSSN